MDDPSHGVVATIIDLGLSRMECNVDRPGSGEYWTSFDEEIFSGSGDYQYDIYRMMRQHNGNNWEKYKPLTNIMVSERPAFSAIKPFSLSSQWLHYLVDKLLNNKGLRAPSGRAAPTDDPLLLTSAQAERRAYACLREVDTLLSSSIAPLARAVKVKSLKKRKDVVARGVGTRFGCASELLGYGVKQGWIAMI
jgi:serine/threonine-protein kinase haspin